MEIVHERCAGMDVSKREAKVCVRVAGRGCCKTVETVSTWASTTNAVLRLREHLVAERVSLVVVMEATGDYWKPFYYLLEDAGFEVMLVNAREVKNLPGRKSDVSDAVWLAQLGVSMGWSGDCSCRRRRSASLRDLTRTRTLMTRERGREIQRLEKLLEDAGIKLSSVASDITGVSGRLMLQALIDGEHDPATLADLAKRRLRGEDPRVHAGADWTVQRPPRVPGADAPGGDRPAHPPDRGLEHTDRGGDGALSSLQRADPHHPRDRATLRGGDRGRDRSRHGHLPDRSPPGRHGPAPVQAATSPPAG